MIVAKDITKIKETEQKLIEAKDAAEEANLSKGRFLSNMSHEIRTPLNGIIGFTDMLKTTNLDEDQGEYVEMISNSGSNLSKKEGSHTACFRDFENCPPASIRYSIAGTLSSRFKSPGCGRAGF